MLLADSLRKLQKHEGLQVGGAVFLTGLQGNVWMGVLQASGAGSWAWATTSSSGEGGRGAECAIRAREEGRGQALGAGAAPSLAHLPG